MLAIIWLVSYAILRELTDSAKTLNSPRRENIFISENDLAPPLKYFVAVVIWYLIFSRIHKESWNTQKGCLSLIKKSVWNSLACFSSSIFSYQSLNISKQWRDPQNQLKISTFFFISTILSSGKPVCRRIMQEKLQIFPKFWNLLERNNNNLLAPIHCSTSFKELAELPGKKKTFLGILAFSYLSVTFGLEKISCAYV